MKILVVDDETLIRDVIKEYAINEGYTVIEAGNGEEALEKVDNNPDIDLIIMDIMMPKLDGYSACKEIFKTKKYPVIMLSARKEEYDKLLGFDLGIDDYVTKPFSPKELIARIKAVYNRANPISSNQESYVYEDLEINYKAHTVKIEGKEVKLTPREQLVSSVWGYDFYGDDRTVDTHIKMLRNHMGKYRDLIKTVRAIGCKFEKDNE